MSLSTKAGGSTDLRILHFVIPVPTTTTHIATSGSHPSLTTTTPATTAAASNRDSFVLAKIGTHEWLCQLSIQEEIETIRATLGPIPSTKANVAALGDCCSLQVLGSVSSTSLGSLSRNDGFHESGVYSLEQVLLTKKIRPEEIFSRGIEFYLDHDTVWATGGDDNIDNDNRTRSNGTNSVSSSSNSYFTFCVILSTHPIKLLGPPDGLKWTHALKVSDTDPADRTIDPLVEMMIRFQGHASSTDILFKFLSPLTGEEVEMLRAHQAILSIHPVFSERVFAAQTDRNPHVRRPQTLGRSGDDGKTVLEVTADRFEAFERMMNFIYSGQIPHTGFCIGTSKRPSGSGDNGVDQWKTTFELTKEYGLRKSLSARPWMDWHTRHLRRLLTEENVLEVYFGWGYAHPTVARDCVEFLVKRPVMPLPSIFVSPHSHFGQQQRQGRPGSNASTSLGSSSSSSPPLASAAVSSSFSGAVGMDDDANHVLRLVRDQYKGRPGCAEFQDLFVAMKLELYHQQKKKKEQQ